MAAAATSIWHRKRDACYIAYIVSACVFPFLIDFAVYYPVESPHWSTSFYDWMLETFNDPLYQRHHPFLAMYTAVEAFYLLPHGLWVIRGLLKDDTYAAFHALLWSWYMVQSCAVCASEIWWTPDWPLESIHKTIPSYIVFFFIGLGMFLDMFSRVRSSLATKQKVN